MYRNWNDLRDGWTKNLALLFPRPGWMAVRIVAWWAFAWITLPLLIPAIALYWRVLRANFRRGTTLVAAAFGPPIFGYLLLRSRAAHERGSVLWKGRRYSDRPSESGVGDSEVSPLNVSRPAAS